MIKFFRTPNCTGCQAIEQALAPLEIQELRVSNEKEIFLPKGCPLVITALAELRIAHQAILIFNDFSSVKEANRTI